MLQRVVLANLLVVMLWAGAVSAGPFDCANPGFGQPIASMNDNDYFVRFMEKDGVTYYNFTGPCRLAVHERLAPVIFYGAVDGKLYSRVMQTEDHNIEIVKRVTTKLAGEPVTSKDGDWVIMRWDFPEKHIKMKLKYNTRTYATKSAMYYEPLRPKAGSRSPEDALDN